MAAEYLAATADQPLLCVEAVNPGLYAAVPVMARARDLRKQACSALSAVMSSRPEADLLVGWPPTPPHPLVVHACSQGCNAEKGQPRYDLKLLSEGLQLG